MSHKEFNPNEIGQPNGNYFALPYTSEEAEIILISVPWDVTTSYKPGTSQGPDAIIEASAQVDLFDFEVENVWKIAIAGTEIDLDAINTSTRNEAIRVIEHLEQGGHINDDEIESALKAVNGASEFVNKKVYDTSKQILSQNKLAAVVGGEHSVPFGLIKAVSEKYPQLGILHIDAHADLRKTYEGFENSHASIMYNVINKLDNVSKLVQVAIRDLCEEEMELIRSHEKIVMFPDEMLQEMSFTGVSWNETCRQIVNELPQKVYISFDIDGLDPSLCPNTGTPVPGGLSYNQAIYLMRQVATSGREIVGFDLCETAPGEDEWDANTASRILFKLCCNMYLSQHSSK